MKSGSEIKTLFYGIGNPIRGDDALGPMMIEWLEKENLFQNATYLWNYQLQIEDAELIDHYDQVIFIDAHVNLEHEFEFTKLEPALHPEYSSHSVHPESILALNRQFFKGHVDCYLLALKAMNFELCSNTP
ncbi:MAG: hypothetical protein Fur0010_20260 [Bdellovibrio sp.]